MTCEHCQAGDKPIKMKRQYVHRIAWQTYVCSDAGFGYQEPGKWAETRPIEWTPRRIRRQER